MAHDESNEKLARLSVNFERRQYEIFSPNFRIDTGNPQQGYNGACVYDLYANTDEGDISLVGMAQGGIFHIYNDRTIEIVGGQKSTEGGVDVCIVGKNGDVWLTAMNGGGIKIRGEDIVIDADNDLTLQAGNNLKIKSDNKIEIKAPIANCHAKLGNLCGDKMSFMGGAFASTYVQAAAIAAGNGFVGGIKAAAELGGSSVGGPVGGAVAGRVVGGIV